MESSALVSYLKDGYCHGVSPDLRREEYDSGRFEIKDKEPSIIQNVRGDGVAVFENRSMIPVEILDFERYLDSIGDSEEKCDFILSPIASYGYIIFCELTASEIKFVLPYNVPSTGERRQGKRAKAISQLQRSIDRFYEKGAFLDQYDRKIALFSCRLTDSQRIGGTLQKAMNGFMRPSKKLSNIRCNSFIHDGFVFEQRIYDKAFIIS